MPPARPIHHPFFRLIHWQCSNYGSFPNRVLCFPIMSVMCPFFLKNQMKVKMMHFDSMVAKVRLFKAHFDLAWLWNFQKLSVVQTFGVEIFRSHKNLRSNKFIWSFGIFYYLTSTPRLTIILLWPKNNAE